MDASDFKGPSGVSMALMDSEGGGMARVARGSAGYWDSEIPGESAVPVAQTLSGVAVRAVHSSFTCPRDAIDDHLAIAPLPVGQYTSKGAKQELARGLRAILNLGLDQAFAIVAALELDVRDLPPPIKNR